MAVGVGAVVVGFSAALVLDHPAADGRGSGAEVHARATPSAAPTERVKAAVASPSATRTPSLRVAPSPSTDGAASCLHVRFKLPNGPAGCKPKADICAPGAPWYVADILALCGGPTPLQAVHIISEPATGGDPGSSYCLAWTGSGEGTGKDAALLMNAPGYQCGAALVGADGQAIQADDTSVFTAIPPDCADSYPDTRMTYPAVLDFPNDGGAQPPEYVCVLANVGA
ncbi:hypothetical protein [Streptomyces sp. NBC_00212]|uniref:hypothetical protein n=1 Tax=Streptomyces sp. NBC_00212 TaxID=2975684 RepID=UPI00324F8E29